MELRPGEELFGLGPLRLQGRDDSCEDGHGDGGRRGPDVQRRLRGPLARPLLLGGVEDLFDKGLPGLRVHVAQDLLGYFNEVRGELPLVPAAENIRHLGAGHGEAPPHEVVGLGERLHDGVLDPVVDHLHVVASGAWSEVGATRPFRALGGDLLEELLGELIGLPVPPGHDGGTVQGPMLPAGDPHPQVPKPSLFRLGQAPLGVSVVGIASVHHDVSRLKEREELREDRVRRASCLDHEQDLPRSGNFFHQLL